MLYGYELSAAIEAVTQRPTAGSQFVCDRIGLRRNNPVASEWVRLRLGVLVRHIRSKT